MSGIILLVHLRVSDPEAFRVAADKLVAISDAEPGTLRYEWFQTDDGSQVRIIEEFVDEAALAAHSANITAVAAELLAVSEFVSTGVLGEVSAEQRERRTSPTSDVYAPYAGFRS
jgi:quinol monooxygenase YgiN